MKNVGEGAVDSIIASRKAQGPFVSMDLLWLVQVYLLRMQPVIYCLLQLLQRVMLMALPQKFHCLLIHHSHYPKKDNMR